MLDISAAGRWGDCDMSLRERQSGSRLGEQDTPSLDLSGGEMQAGLLSRLKNQNSALEKLRLALDGEDDARDATYPALLVEPAKG